MSGPRGGSRGRAHLAHGENAKLRDSQRHDGSAGPTALLAGLFAITVVFGQLISNTATALVMIPIGVSAAAQLDISARKDVL